MTIPATAIIILAGGRATRMGGGDKARLHLAGRPILAWVVGALRPQAPRIALSANGDPTRFADLALPVLPDADPGFPGPLAGVLAGLDWAATLGLAWLVSAPADCPFLPPDLLARLHAGRAGHPYACAASAGRTHPVAALWPTDCRERLRAALGRGERRVGSFATPRALVDWPADPVDPFFNVNTPADLEAARRLALTPAGAVPPPQASPPCTSPAAATLPRPPG